MRNEDNFIRSINVDKEDWKEAKVKARSEGTTLSKIIRNAIKAYLGRAEPNETRDL